MRGNEKKVVNGKNITKDPSVRLINDESVQWRWTLKSESSRRSTEKTRKREEFGQV